MIVTGNTSFTWCSNKGQSKRGEAPLFNIIPPPLIREGEKGGGLPKIKNYFIS